MHRSGSAKICAMLLALWVPMVVGETSPVPQCAQHHPAPHGASTAPTGHHHGPAPSKEASHSCTCIGGCTIARAALTVPGTPQVEFEATIREVDPAQLLWLPVPSRDRAFLQYATGPPLQA